MICNICGWEGPLSEFPKRGRNGPPRGECKKCKAKSSRNSHLWVRYGITLVEYEELLKEQGGVCGICGREPSGSTYNTLHLDVDHDTKTGQVRGLLCRECNMVLGKIGDSMEGLARVYRYLKKAQLRGR